MSFNTQNQIDTIRTLSSSFEGERVPLLDHGYMKLVEFWGSDERIVEAARMSTNKGFLGWDPGPCEECEGTGEMRSVRGGEPTADACHTCEGTGKLRGDARLLRYLYENKHSTPFEMAGMVIEVQAPIFVFREWHRHRTQSYNEMSARYTPLPDLNYVPTVERLLFNSKTNRQAGTVRGADVLSEAGAELYTKRLKANYEQDEKLYQQALAMGVPKELARVHLPVGRYSRMRASTCLRNWLAFLTLRTAPGAQWEIRQYAHEVERLVETLFPRTHKLFVDEKP